MIDLFNLNNINASLLNNIKDLAQITVVCETFASDPTIENGQKIVEIIQKTEKNMLKVKKNIVIMLNIVDEEHDVINVKVSENGFILE